jgi:hypothetical protein
MHRSVSIGAGSASIIPGENDFNKAVESFDGLFGGKEHSIMWKGSNRQLGRRVPLPTKRRKAWSLSPRRGRSLASRLKDLPKHSGPSVPFLASLLQGASADRTTNHLIAPVLALAVAWPVIVVIALIEGNLVFAGVSVLLSILVMIWVPQGTAKVGP